MTRSFVWTRRGRWLGAAIAVSPPLAAFALMLAFRSHSTLLRRTIGQLNRTVLNPMNLRTAGEPGSRYSVVTHRGRTTGRTHRTPVGATATPTGFVVPLPYGPDTDWVRNLLAAGRGLVLHDGREIDVEQPEVTPVAEVRGLFAPGEQRVLSIFGVEHALLLQRRA